MARGEWLPVLTHPPVKEAGPGPCHCARRRRERTPTSAVGENHLGGHQISRGGPCCDLCSRREAQPEKLVA